MGKKDGLTKALAIGGTALVWLPILAPFFFGLGSLIGDGRFRFDFLMPAELFPVILVGAAILLWAAIRARDQVKLIGWGIGSAVAALLIGQGLAVVTGLASGAQAATGWRIVLVIAIFVIFLLAVIVTGIGGILLLSRLFKHGPTTKE